MGDLKPRLIKRITAEGPMSIASFMAASLFDPVDGFYPTRDPLGADGDFITAPEISQMFGEMIGLWCVQSWRDMGSPPSFNLIELGPGRGVMMSDILRAARIAPDFLMACSVTLIEASPALEMVQAQTLASAPCMVNWVSDLTKATCGPSLIIGNEFLDCLPIRQFILQKDKWHERVVTIDPDNDAALIFAIDPTEQKGVDLSAFAMAKPGDLAEICPGAEQIIDEVAARFSRDKGRALFIDYGPSESEIGDTLQALKAHKKVGPLNSPGNADLTARVDFGALKASAAAVKLPVFGPITQAQFLGAMGIEARAQKLANSHPKSSDILARQFSRLTAENEMGALFKAICLQSSGLSDPIGFTP
ncbi:MAG: SAM-dependent methyltransferase [Robiginitomaculum sp.]